MSIAYSNSWNFSNFGKKIPMTHTNLEYRQRFIKVRYLYEFDDWGQENINTVEYQYNRVNIGLIFSYLIEINTFSR